MKSMKIKFISAIIALVLLATVQTMAQKTMGEATDLINNIIATK